VGQPILLVEDDVSLAQTLIAALEAVGIPVEHSPTGELACELLRAKNYPLLIVELILSNSGGISGGYVVKSVKRLPRGSRPAVIVLASAAASLRGLDRSSVSSMLFKPLDFNLFTEYVVTTYRHALGRHETNPAGAHESFCGACGAPLIAWMHDKPETFDDWADAPCQGCGKPPRIAGGRSTLLRASL
jgi:DNA-binding response OmpR family regulator